MSGQIAALQHYEAILVGSLPTPPSASFNFNNVFLGSVSDYWTSSSKEFYIIDLLLAVAF